jgi:hypothetical protein
MDRTPESNNPMTNRPLLFVLAIALVTRFVTLWAMPDLTFGDSNEYFQDGRGLFNDGLAPNHIYTPLYSIWIYLTGGGIGTKVADIVLSVLTVWLVFQLTMEIFNRQSIALAAALGAALYPHFMFFSVARLSETLFLCLMCAAFLALYRSRFNWGCVLLVLSVLTRPSTDLIAPLLVVAFALIVHRQSPTLTAKHVIRYALIYLALMSPWWVHNYAKYDTFVRLSLGGGKVLYSGNNPLNTSGGGVANGISADDMDQSEFDTIRDPVLKDRALWKAGAEYIVKNPGRFAELAAIKFVRFWRLWPYAPEYQQPHIIVASLLSYGVALALSLVFLARNIKSHWRKISPLLLFAVYLSAIHMVTIGSIRYRLPLEPFIIILAAYSFAEICCRWSFARKLMRRFGD